MIDNQKRIDHTDSGNENIRGICMKRIKKRKMIKEGWELLWKHPGIMVSSTLLPLVVEVALELIRRHVGPLLGLGVSLVSWVIVTVLWLGVVRLSLDIVDNRIPHAKVLITQWRFFWKSFIASIIYRLALILGGILLLFPGYILALRFGQFQQLIVDRGLGPIQALKASSALTKGYKLQLFQLDVMLLGINILGFLCCVVGLILTAPLTVLVNFLAFRHLEANPLEVVQLDGNASIKMNQGLG